MKLLSKTTLLIVTVSIFIFMMGNIVFFNVSKEMINKHIDSELIGQMHKVVEKIKKSGKSFDDAILFDQVEVKAIAHGVSVFPTFSDTVLYSKIQKQYIPYRSLKFSFATQNHNNLVTLYKSLVSSDKLIERITIASIFMVMVFILMIYVMNRYVFATVWSGFFKSLKTIDEHDIKGVAKIAIEDSEIEEFSKLNFVLSDMVNRIQKDYHSLKELTANTSHEIQTPLAIIKNKAELLLQSEKMDEKELEIAYSILNTAERLAKLNKSLLLITKIENHQFDNSEKLNLKELIEKYLANFEMLFEAGAFKVSSELSPCIININSILLDVLVGNLLKNAIAHGTKSGEIKINLNNGKLTVSNSGNPLAFDADLLFKRFVKGSTSQTSSGLGLEIVKKISEYYVIPVSYSYHNNLHHFSIDFSKISD